MFWKQLKLCNYHLFEVEVMIWSFWKGIDDLSFDLNFFFSVLNSTFDFRCCLVFTINFRCFFSVFWSYFVLMTFYFRYFSVFFDSKFSILFILFEIKFSILFCFWDIFQFLVIFSFFDIQISIFIWIFDVVFFDLILFFRHFSIFGPLQFFRDSIFWLLRHRNTILWRFSETGRELWPKDSFR